MTLVLRFTTRNLVEENAKRHGIDIAWAFAVMHRKVSFMSNARLHAGAGGLIRRPHVSVAKTMPNCKNPPRRMSVARTRHHHRAKQPTYR